MAADLIDQLTSDPDFLSLSETDQDAMYEELSGRQAKPLTLDDRIATRPSAMADLTANPLTWKHPLGSALRTISGAAELYQGVTASVALDLQAGKPQQVIPNIMKVLTGQRPAQYGDVYQGAGVPKPLAAVGGLATDLALAPGGAQAMKELPGFAKAVATGGAKILSRPFQDLGRFGRPATILKPAPFREALVSRVQNRLLNAPKLAGQEFEVGLNEVVKANPTQSVDLSGSLQTYLTQAGKNPAFKTLIERQSLNNQESALVQSLLNQPQTAANLTLQESQMVKQIFQRAIRSKFEKVSPEFFGAHLDALEVWHDIRAAQLSAFPQFKTVLKGYAETLSNFRVVKNILKEGTLEPKLLSNLSNNSQLIKAFRELATPDTLRMVGQLQKSNAMRSFLIRLGIGVAGLTGAGYLAKKVGIPVTGQP